MDGRRFLVIVHAGDRSLHPGWLGDPATRLWDLVVVYGGDDPHRYTDPHDGVIRIARRGPKWGVLGELLAQTQDAWAAYDHVWIPADDLEPVPADIDRLFQVAAGMQLPLAMPSYSADSAAVSPLVKHDPAWVMRYTNVVDAGAAVFSRDFLRQALPSFTETATEAALGRQWPRLLADSGRHAAVVDGLQVRRARAPADARPSKVLPVDLCFGGHDHEGRFVNLEVAPEAAPEPAPEAFVIGTSIAPAGEAKQQRAVASWQALGFEVVSFNNAEEIAALAPRYAGVRFVEVRRDGRARTGKPLVHVDDVFAWFRTSGLARGGFVNSDIVLQPSDAAAFRATLDAEVPGSLVFARRIEVKSLERLQGEPYPTGFDCWFWDSRVLAAFDGIETDYFVGFPHWDYYAILLPLVKGFPVKELVFPFAWHQTHRQFYDVMRDGVPYGLATFERVAMHTTHVPVQCHLIKPVVRHLLDRRPAGFKPSSDRQADHALLHALDLWFLDVIERNARKVGSPAPAATPVQPAPVTPAAAMAPPPAAPLVSVIVPTFNRAPILERCLAHLRAQTLPADRFEVIVVDDGSSDATPEVLAAAGVIHEHQPNLGPAAARNRGLARARGDWVLFLNDDALLEPRALEIHLEEHALRGPKDAVLGLFRMDPGFTPTDRPVGYCMDRSDLVFDFARMRAGQPYGHQHFYTCNVSLARNVLLEHRFDERFVRMGAEDIELGIRLHLAGTRVWYRPDCVALHAHRLDAEGLARMFQFRGKGGVHLHAVERRLVPHYARMPLARIDELKALAERLAPQVQRLHQAIAALDALPLRAGGLQGVPLDERSTGVDLRMLWSWPEGDVVRLLNTLTANLERHTARFAAQPAPLLEEAAGRIYPALQFVKWWNDTLGVVDSDELPAYLASLQRLAA